MPLTLVRRGEDLIIAENDIYVVSVVNNGPDHPRTVDVRVKALHLPEYPRISFTVSGRGYLDPDQGIVATPESVKATKDGLDAALRTVEEIRSFLATDDAKFENANL